MDNEYNITFSKCCKHLKVVLLHKFWVFKFSCYAGIPLQGFLHDFSKFSWVEFWEGARYVIGSSSPLDISRRQNGYSLAWLHHKGRNKHHFEYWIDLATTEKTPVIPYKYSVEMLCDTLAAGKTYKGKSWTKDYQLEYFKHRRDIQWINPKIYNFLLEAYSDVSKDGNIKRVLNKKNLRKIYDKHVFNKV